MTTQRAVFIATGKNAETFSETDVNWPFLEASRPKTPLWERLKEAVENLVFENDDRPIGMTQLTRDTFTPPEPGAPEGVFFKNVPTFCDYGFIKRYQEKPAHGYGTAASRQLSPRGAHGRGY